MLNKTGMLKDNNNKRGRKDVACYVIYDGYVCKVDTLLQNDTKEKELHNYK